jgi:hypothetical protein
MHELDARRAVLREITVSVAFLVDGTGQKADPWAKQGWHTRRGPAKRECYIARCPQWALRRCIH